MAPFRQGQRDAKMRHTASVVTFVRNTRNGQFTAKEVYRNNPLIKERTADVIIAEIRRNIVAAGGFAFWKASLGN
eukprot:236637-Pleurochrysis_carterae.AAC.1